MRGLVLSLLDYRSTGRAAGVHIDLSVPGHGFHITMKVTLLLFTELEVYHGRVAAVTYQVYGT